MMLKGEIDTVRTAKDKDIMIDLIAAGPTITTTETGGAHRAVVQEEVLVETSVKTRQEEV